MKSARRIAIVLNDDFSMWHFFQGLLRTLVRAGHKVYVLTPAGASTAKMEALGVFHIPTPMTRFIDPLGDLRYCIRLAGIFRRQRIDLVCNMTVKPIVYGTLAARLARVPQVVGIIEGLGYTFLPSRGPRDWLLKQIAKLLYRIGCLGSNRVGFSNPDDLALFIGGGYLRRRQAIGFRSMVGVDTVLNAPGRLDPAAVEKVRQELQLPTDRPLVTMISRVVWSKGTREFVEASRLAAGWHPAPLFLLVGPLDPGASDCVPEAYLRDAVSKTFKWVDAFRHDFREILALSDVVVQPSYYREGVPRILLEGLAFAKPIVTTHNVGCRETVDENVNGFLVPVKDAPAFAGAVKTLVEDPARRLLFGRQSRLKAEREFDEAKVVRAVIERLFQLEVPIAEPGPV